MPESRVSMHPIASGTCPQIDVGKTAEGKFTLVKT